MRVRGATSDFANGFPGVTLLGASQLEVFVRAAIRTGVSLLGLAMFLAAGPAAQSTRPTVAVLGFEFGSIQQWWSGNQDIGTGISDMLVDELLERRASHVRLPVLGEWRSTQSRGRRPALGRRKRLDHALLVVRPREPYLSDRA